MKYSIPFPSKRKKVWLPIHLWLWETLGRSGNRWKAKQDRYYFRYEEDLILFKLRWE